MSKELENTEKQVQKSRENASNENNITMTQEELNKMIESESDKKINKALETRDAKWQAELDKRVEQAIREDKRIASLSEKERHEEQLKQREAELLEREQSIKLSEIRNEAINELSNRNINSNFADFLVTDDGEKTFENIKKFNELLDETINSKVKELTRQDAPRAGGTNLVNGNKKSSDVLELARQSRIIK